MGAGRWGSGGGDCSAVCCQLFCNFTTVTAVSFSATVVPVSTGKRICMTLLSWHTYTQQTIDHICHWESLQNARKYYSLVTLVPIIPKGSSLLETCSTCQTKQNTKRPTDLKMNLEKHIHEWRLAESEHSLECLGRPDVPRGLMVLLCVILIWLSLCVILAYWGGGGGVQTEKFSKFLGF